jgi:predicted dehydrogenase
MAVRQLVARGVIGRPSFVQITITAGYWHPTHHPQAPWMYRRELGGGYLMGELSHQIDFVNVTFGTPVAVCADVRHSVPRVSTPAGEIEVTSDDIGALLLRLDSGALAVLTNSAAGLGAGTNLFEVHGSNGTIARSRFPTGDGSFVVSVDGGEPQILEPSNRELESGVELPARRSSVALKAMALMLEDWRPAFQGLAAPTPTIRDGWLVQQVVDAALRSSAGDGWVPISGAP